MSKHKIAKQIRKLMTTNGFKIIRQTNHYVWQNAEGLIITTCKTPSDNYDFKSCPQNVDGTGDFDCSDYVSDWEDWEGVDVSLLFDIHKACLFNKHEHSN